MLSTKNPPDPSCSSKLPVLRGGESASEKIASQGGDPILEETPAPNFCIRDYVFASRSKSIETSWPFTPHILQLCSKHGIKDLLPPFEPPGLVRIQCQRKGVELVRPVVCSDVERTLPHVDPQVEAANRRHHSCSLLEKPSPDEKSLTCWSVSKDEPVHSSAHTGPYDQVERSSTEIDSVSCLLAKGKGVPKTPLEIDIVEPTKKLGSSCEPSETKCRLTVKLGVICENSWTEDKTSNSSILSDPMASSKVCPVCKTFSSTSNTTLNAHIDQCLSTESYNKCVSTEFLTPKVKPRKKRSMVDIYATAPHCTLEDLDKRNGSNWANELAFVAAPIGNGIVTETKKPKLATFDSKADANGAVYVDSNGVKLGIVSKLNGTPQLKDERGLQKYTEVVGTSKQFLISKKHLSAKYLKKMKVKAQKKKLCPFVLFKAQIQTALGGDCNAGVPHENGESLSHVSAENLSKSCTSASLRKWICSRRSDIPKKLVNKNVHAASGNTELLTRSRLAEHNRSEVGTSSVAIRHHLKISRSDEDSTCSPKTNRIEFLPKTAHSMDATKHSRKLSISISTSRCSSENTSERSFLLRTSKPSENFVASSQSKAKEFELDIQHKSDSSCDSTNIPSDICNSSVKDRIKTTFNNNDLVRRQPFNLAARKCDLNEEPSASNTFRKRRSISRSSKSRAEFQSATKGVHGPGDDIAKTSKFDHSKVVNPPNEGDTINNASPLSKDVSECDDIDDRSTIEDQKHCNTLDAEHSHMQGDVSETGNYVSKPTVETSAGNPLSNDCGHSEILQIDMASRFKPSPVIAHSQFMSESEVHEKQLTKISEKQEVCCNDVSREINGESIQMAYEMEEGMGKDSCVAQPTECTADAMSVQESSGCLTSQGGALPDIPKKSNSIASPRVAANNAMNLAGDGELCGSPVPATSTISLTSPKDPKFTESDTEPSATAINAKDKLDSVTPITEDKAEAEGINSEVRNDGIKEKLPSKASNRSAGDKLFPCSCRESLSRETRLSRSNNAYGTTKGRQVSNLFAGSRVSSSFSSYQNQRTNTMISTNLQPAAQSTSVKTFSALGSATPSQSQTQAISNPVLRLMGKNLMVVNNEEFVQSSSVSLDYPPHRSLPSSPHGFASTSYNHLKQENFKLHHQVLGGSPTVSPAVSVGEHRFPTYIPNIPMAGFSMTQLCTGLVPRPDQSAQQKNAFRKTNSSPAPYMKNEVILIDDSPDTEDALINFHTSGSNPYTQRPYSNFSPQCRLAHLPGGARPLLPNPYISVGNNLMEISSTSEGHGPLLSSPLMFQSPATPRMRSSVCYSQLR